MALLPSTAAACRSLRALRCLLLLGALHAARALQIAPHLPSDDQPALEAPSRTFADQPRQYGVDRSGGSMNDASCFASASSTKASDAACADEPERLLFLHIPKSAGTAIEEAGLASGVRWGKEMDFGRCDPGQGSCFAKWHEPPALMSAVNVYSASKVFCVVRNPYLRLISEYKYINDYPEYRFEHSDLIQTEGCSANGLNEWVARVMSVYKQGFVYEQLCHILPQSFYIWGPQEQFGQQCQYCQEILHQEHLPGAFNDLMVKYNYSIRLGEEPVNGGGCPNLGPMDLNTTNLAMIRDVYRHDFQKLNYSVSLFATR